MRKLLLTASLIALFAGQVEAGVGTITVKDATGVTQTFALTTDASGHFVSDFVLCDQSAAAQCATITVGNAVKVDASATTQPISAVSLPLPAGAATLAKQPALGTAGLASVDVITIQGIASMTALKVDPSAVTSPISAASLPLPAGAATLAKQPALGTAGSASNDVITIQGIASMTPLKVDGSANTQPVSAASLPLPSNAASETGGNLASLGNTTQTIGSAVPSKAVALGVEGSGNLKNIIACDNYAKYDASTTGDTQIIAASGSTTIYVCGYNIHIGGTATNVKLTYGTGSNCGTGNTALTPAWQFIANAGKVVHSPFWAGLKTTGSQALCVNASAANAVQVEVYFTQF